MNLKIFKQKDFSLLMLGKLVSLFGSNMQQFALSLYVLGVTGSATIFASILSISILPRLILSPIAAVFGDWFDRKKSIVILDLINSLIIGSFAVIYISTGEISIPMIYILVILLEITEIFFGSSMSAVLPSIVEKEELMDANSVRSLVGNIGNILAPIIAAFIYGTFGLKIIFIVNAISFLLSAISEMFIRIPKTHKRPEKIDIKSFKTDLMEGIDTIKGNKLISAMIGLGTVINFAASPLFSIGLVFILKEVLIVSDIEFGLFQMILSSSMLFTPILLGGFMKKTRLGKLCLMSISIISGLVIIMSIVPSSIFLNFFSSNFIPYILLTVISFMIGLVVTVVNISIGTLLNQIVPMELMGRTSTVFVLGVTIFTPIGQMIFGYLFDIISTSVVVNLMGFILILAIMKYKSKLLGYDEECKMEENEDISIKEKLQENIYDIGDVIDEV